MREIHNLKRLADYSSRDTTNLNSFLQSIGSEFSVYTYSMLNAGVDKDSIRLDDIFIFKSYGLFRNMYSGYVFSVNNQFTRYL